MIQYISQRQLRIEEFETPFEGSLLPDNRWVKLSKVVPWDSFAKIYMSVMNSEIGRPGISPRIVLGALIIKHLENLDDRSVISNIQENIYMQYFVGLKGFCSKPIFDASLFVEIRKRIGASTFDKLNEDLIKSISAVEDKKQCSKKREYDDLDLPPNSGRLQMDATVADQYITYPTDAKILNSSRKQCEKIIDKLYELNGKKDTKPRTYRRKMDTSFWIILKRNQNQKRHTVR
ncbi:MAG: transposase [Flavobacteriaceae bacterium]|nr:transposase [Flavobacteriaceae bacterium]